MKDRLGYSHRLVQNHSSYDIGYSQNPLYSSYEATIPSEDSFTKNSQPYATSFKEFSRVKKVSDDVSGLRQTMNYKTDRIKTSPYGEQSQHPTKASDYLRQTLNSKTTRPMVDRNLFESGSTRANAYKQQNFLDNYKTSRNNDPYHIPENRSAVNLMDNSSGFREYEKLNEKIDRNKKMIQQLRKTAGKMDAESYQKSPTYSKAPVYGQLEREKQQEGFKKKKTEDNSGTFTPKVDKSSYQYRVNSTPTIELKKTMDKRKEESTVTSFNASLYLPKPRQLQPTQTRGNLLSEFTHGKKLGQGKFGLVTLVVHKKTSGVFALKKIPKEMIKSHLMVDQLALQIRLQSSLRHRNVLGMYGFFDDSTHLYIVLEYMEGGTLYQKLKKGKGKLNEKETACVIRQMVQAIEYLHDLGIAHRDIKPENIVISNDVYKLCDFGWAALCNERRKTYCGTFDYVAPQILQGTDYDMTVDLWCLGVMTFELLTGKAPFYHISRKQTMKKILNVENQIIEYPKDMSQDAKDLIDKLIRKNPLQRIKASEALVHPFLINADCD